MSMILGISADEMGELGLKSDHLLILRWFADQTKTAKQEIMAGKKYYRVAYNDVSRDIPVIHCNKDGIMKKFGRLVDTGVLTHETLREGGTFALYGFGPNYSRLLKSDEE